MVKELADLVKDIDTPYTKDPVMLLRFVRARGTVKGAFEQYRNMCQWRKDNKVDEIEADSLPKVLYGRYYTAEGLWGETREGQPVFWQHPAFEDYGGRESAGGGWEAMIRAVVYGMDRLDAILRHQSVKKGKVVDSMMVICDLKGLAIRHCTSG